MNFTEHFTLHEIMADAEKWLKTGELNIAMLSADFQFVSPFWESNNKDEFVEKFKDPKEYREKSLSNILSYDPFIRLTSEDGNCFAFIFQYHTKYNVSVDETVLGVVADGLLVELRSIYDLEKTKLAHKLA